MQRHTVIPCDNRYRLLGTGLHWVGNSSAVMCAVLLPCAAAARSVMNDVVG